MWRLALLPFMVAVAVGGIVTARQAVADPTYSDEYMSFFGMRYRAIRSPFGQRSFLVGAMMTLVGVLASIAIVLAVILDPSG